MRSLIILLYFMGAMMATALKSTPLQIAVLIWITDIENRTKMADIAKLNLCEMAKTIDSLMENAKDPDYEIVG